MYKKRGGEGGRDGGSNRKGLGDGRERTKKTRERERKLLPKSTVFYNGPFLLNILYDYKQ